MARVIYHLYLLDPDARIFDRYDPAYAADALSAATDTDVEVWHLAMFVGTFRRTHTETRSGVQAA
jgi:hypothetical protein